MKPTFAIIGCGRIAKRHAEQITKVGTLVAVCDIVLENAVDLARDYNAKFYLSIEELLNKETSIDVVSICTPNGMHAGHAILALKAGKHVLCEKPLSISVDDAKEMAETANMLDKKLFVVKQNRYNPPVEFVKQLLEEDKLGNIFSFQINCFWNRPPQYYSNSWKGSRSLDGGTLFTQFSHFVDLLYWFLGEVKEVKAVTKNFEHPSNEIEDCGVAIIEMLSGAIGSINYSVNCFQQNMEGSFTIIGKKGSVKIGGQYLNTLEYQCIDGEEKRILPSGNTANNYGFYQGSMSNHDKVYENLVRALHEPGYEFASAFDGLKTVEIIEKIYTQAGKL